MNKAKQIYHEGKQVDVMNTGIKLTGYFITGSVTEVRQRHSHRTYVRHIVTVTWYEDEDVGDEEGTYTDIMRLPTYSTPADAIRQCIRDIDDCAEWLSGHMSDGARSRMRLIPANEEQIPF